MSGKIIILLVFSIACVHCAVAGPLSDQSLESKVNQLEELYKKIVEGKNTCEEKFKNQQYYYGNIGGETPIEADTEDEEENDFKALFSDMKTELKRLKHNKQSNEENQLFELVSEFVNVTEAIFKPSFDTCQFNEKNWNELKDKYDEKLRKLPEDRAAVETIQHNLNQINLRISNILEDAKVNMEQLKTHFEADIDRKLQKDFGIEYKNSLKDEIKSALKDALKDEIQEELKANNEFKQRIKNELQNEIRNNFRNELKNELEVQIRNEVQNELKKTMITEIKNELEMKIKNQLLNLKIQVGNELKNDLKREQKSNLKQELIHEIQLQLRSDIDKALKQKLEGNFVLESNLNVKTRDQIESQVKESIQHELTNISITSQELSPVSEKKLRKQLKKELNTQIKNEITSFQESHQLPTIPKNLTIVGTVLHLLSSQIDQELTKLKSHNADWINFYQSNVSKSLADIHFIFDKLYERIYSTEAEIQKLNNPRESIHGKYLRN